MMNDNRRIDKNSFVTLHYRLGDGDGSDYVSTFDMSPATLQMGGGQLAETLENCLIGLAQGERRVFELSPGEAFGEHNPLLLERIRRDALPPEVELKENALIEFSTPQGGSFAGFLRKIEADGVLVFDFNHPLAGKPIRFEVAIIGVM